MSDTRFKKGQKPWNAGTRFHLEKVCQRCQKVFFVNIPSFKNQKFCSKSCGLMGNSNAINMKPNRTSFKKGHIPWSKGKNNSLIAGIKHPNWKGGLLTRTCEAINCNNIFSVKPSKVRVGWGRFCSKKCSNRTTMQTEGRKDIIRRSNLFRKPTMKDTSIEVKLQNFLKGQGIEFSTHYPILGQPDIFIKPNICIFADGCYWHKCSECGFEESVRKERLKDKKVTTELQKQGFIVFRIWEHDIRTNNFSLPIRT